jgi:hypothetical protein
MRRIAALPVLTLALACAGGEPAPADDRDATPAPSESARPGAPGPAAEAAQREFLARYGEYCGRSFPGHSVLVDLGDDHPLEGATLRMILESCTDREVRIAFHVDDDRSRTWILTLTDRGLHLAHDHRYEDGTEHPANFYGGFADGRGSPTRQFFPADDRTIADRPARDINVWSKEFDVDRRRYYYRLYLRGDLSYEAEFDLTDDARAGNP